MKLVSIVSIALSLAIGHQALAKDIKIQKRVDRTRLMEKATVWQHPSWLSQNFEFSRDLDVLGGGPVKGNDKLLQQNVVTCKVTPDDLEINGTGKTPKFKCSLMEYADGQNRLVVSKKGKLDDIKVKYGALNAEIYGEVIATRLLWALGFGADRMFRNDEVICYGCTAEPFKDRRVDASTMVTPRIIHQTAIERKFEGDEIIFDNPPRSGRPSEQPMPMLPEAGWSFSEAMHNLPSPSTGKLHDEKIKRDALRLLSVFMQHVDSKADNHRLVCLKEEGGKCVGDVRMILQDVGATFGGGTLINKLRISKVELEYWKSKPIWTDAANCRANFGLAGDFKLMAPRISEEGRAFLAKLLVGFSEGAEGRKRVEDLFRAAKINMRGDTAEEWADAFMVKVREIQDPTGTGAKCPESVYN